MSTKRCPMCHSLNKVASPECRCGYEFGQDVDKVLALLRTRRMNARIVLALLLVTNLVAIGAFLYVAFPAPPLIYILVFAALFTATGHAVLKLSTIRTSLRQLSKRKLPKATLREP